MQTAHVLLAEDDRDIQQLIKIILNPEQIRLTLAENGREALDKWNERPVDLFILDWMMPVMDGFTTLQSIRRVSNVPVIFLTVRGNEQEIIEAFNAGANDYIIKPFSAGEFLARVRTRLRRGWQKEKENSGLLTYADLVVDLHSRRVSCQGEPVELSKMEFNLLAYLLSHAGVVVSKQELLEKVWGYPHMRSIDVDTNLIEAAITRLRRKIQFAPNCLQYIRTVRGTGYLFGAEP